MSKIVDIDLWEIDNICNNYAIGLTQMGYVYPRIMKCITKDNQKEVLTKVGVMANEGWAWDNIITLIRETYSI